MKTQKKTPPPVVVFNIEQFSKDVKKRFNKVKDDYTKPNLLLLSKSLDISVATLSRVINGGSLPDLKTFGILCQWMEISPQRYFPELTGFEVTNYEWMD